MHRLGLRIRLSVCWICMAVAVKAQPVDFDPVPACELFVESAAPVPGARPQSPSAFEVMRSVRLAIDVWESLRPGTVFTVTPEERLPLSCVVTEVRIPSPSVRIVKALVDSDAANLLMLVAYEDAIAMTLRVPSRDLVYRLHFVGDGDYEVWRVDQARVSPELCYSVAVAVDAAPRILMPGDDDWSPPAEDGGTADAGGCGGATPVIDTMVIYTPAARTACGGHAAIRAESALAIELTNEAYFNSQLAVRARLVYCNEINYTEAANMVTDLDRLTGTSDGFMDGVHALRDSLDADLVALFTNTGTGIAWCPSSPAYHRGFSVSAWDLAASNFTHAHETGHNLGAGHDRDNNGPCSGGPDYGVGWRFTGNDGITYRTVLAYSPGIRVTHYSNPAVTYRGTATGVPIGQQNPAYNALVIASNDNAVVNFELTRYDIYVDFGWILFEDGTPSWPYNTLPEGVNAIATPGTGAAENPSLYIRAGATNWTGVVTKAMVMRSCDGSVRIGN